MLKYVFAAVFLMEISLFVVFAHSCCENRRRDKSGKRLNSLSTPLCFETKHRGGDRQLCDIPERERYFFLCFLFLNGILFVGEG